MYVYVYVHIDISHLVCVSTVNSAIVCVFIYIFDTFLEIPPKASKYSVSINLYAHGSICVCRRVYLLSYAWAVLDYPLPKTFCWAHRKLG